MMFKQWCVFLGLVSLVAGGIVKMPEELPADIAADNAYLDDYAANALLTVEERKIVALLERIESKFGTLQENEKEEFVKKISNYQDRFASTLAKVETIPGMYGLNVDMLRANLGIPANEEHVEEIHEDFEDVIGGNNVPEATVEDSSVDVEANVSEELESMARRAQLPRSQKKSSQSTKFTKPQKTMDDLYNVMAQLVNLVMVQIVQANNKPEPVAQLPSMYLPPSPVPQASYYPSYPNPTPAPRSRMPKPPKAHRFKNKSTRKPAQPVHRFPTPSPYYHDLQSLFSAIPPVYDEVHVNIGKNRKRRGAPDGGYDSVEAKAAYAKWYNDIYLPWYNHYQYQMQKYMQELKAYEAAKLAQSMPSYPFGNPASGMQNKFYTYSKQAYKNHLYEQVKGTDPTVTHAEAFAKWSCERESTRVTDPLYIDSGEDCYIAATATTAGECVTGGADGSGGCIDA